LKLHADTTYSWLESEKLTIQKKPNAEFKTSGQNARYLRAISFRIYYFIHTVRFIRYIHALTRKVTSVLLHLLSQQFV
jgi:hypothetical protein